MGAFIQELFQANLYKRTQGRLARQVTAVAIAIIGVIGAWSLRGWMSTQTNSQVVQYGVPLGLAMLAVWVAFRAVHVPAFADFLISVEAEMNKVSWPSRAELTKASIVVMVVIFFLAAVLYLYDTGWRFLLDQLNIF